MIEPRKPEGKKKINHYQYFVLETSSMRILQYISSLTADDCLLQVCNLTRFSSRAHTSGIAQKATVKSDTKNNHANNHHNKLMHNNIQTDRI